MNSATATATEQGTGEGITQDCDHDIADDDDDVIKSRDEIENELFIMLTISYKNTWARKRVLLSTQFISFLL